MREPPTTVSLHPMLMPVLCVGGNAFEMWDTWMATGAQHMGIYLYHDDLRFIMPKLDVHQSARRIAYIVASGRARHFYQEFYGIYPLDGMVGYVENELLWDPRLPVDDILDEYYALFYRDAAEPMRAFYAALEDGYERWLAERGLPHPFGMDASSITDSRSLEQFRVLPEDTLQTALAALDEALAAAQRDELVTQRIGVVKVIFEFAVPGARMYWAMDRLRERDIASVADTERAVADARIAVDQGIALADYKFAVALQPPSTDYAARTDSAEAFDDLQQGAAPAEVLRVVAGAMRAAGDAVRAELGPAGAEAWWDTQAADGDHESLRKLLNVGRAQSAGIEVANLVADPSFEERGAGSAAAAEGVEEAPEHESLDGVSFWHGAGTPYHATLTDADAHTGEWSFTMTDTQRAGVSHSIAVEGGEVLLMSLWVKHNAGAGDYYVQVIPRSDRMLSRAQVPVPEEPDVWHQVEMAVIVPPEARTVGLYLFCERQTPGAQVFVDDYFIGRYEVE